MVMAIWLSTTMQIKEVNDMKSKRETIRSLGQAMEEIRRRDPSLAEGILMGLNIGNLLHHKEDEQNEDQEH